MKTKIDKYSLVSCILTCICIILGILLFFILPEEIAIQWNSDGVSHVAARYSIFLFPGLSLLFLFFGKAFMNYTICRYFHNTNDRMALFISMYFQIIFLTCEVYTGLFAFGIRLTISMILMIEAVIGILCGIRVSKNQ